MNKTELNEALARYREEFRYLEYVSEAGEEIWRDPQVNKRDVRNILVLGEKKYFEFLHIFQSDHPDFSGMDLSGLAFDGAFFDRNEKFVNTLLIGASIGENFIENDMRGADFSYANLRGSSFEHCNLIGACFDGADLEKVKFVGCSMRGCNITKDCGAEFIDCYGLPWFTLGTRAIKIIKTRKALRDVIPFTFENSTDQTQIIVN